MSAYIDLLVKREKAKAPLPFEAGDLIEWHEQRALIERQLGHNQLSAGNEAGQLRIDRAKKHEATAKLLRRIE